MKRVLSCAALLAATVSSIATSSVEDDLLLNGGDASIGEYQTFTTVSPGGQRTRSFTIAIPEVDLDDVTGASVYLRATAQPAADWSTLRATISGPAGTASFELYADATDTFTDQVRIQDGLDGCSIVGDACSSVWQVRFEHLDGTAVVDVDYTISATVVGPDTTVEID